MNVDENDVAAYLGAIGILVAFMVVLFWLAHVHWSAVLFGLAVGAVALALSMDA